MMAVMCVTVLATRQSPSGTQLAVKRATLINTALASHGYKGVAANIHVQLQSLTLAQKAAISKLSESDRQEMEGEIMLKAAEETLARAAAHKKQQLAQIAFHHQMLSENATNGTNSTEPAEEATVNAGEFDLSAWLNSFPDPSKWTDPMPGKGFDLSKFLKCQPTFDLSAWLRDSSKGDLMPGCPTTRLSGCEDKDFEDAPTKAKCCRVEVKHDNVWGLVCDDSGAAALAAAAKVACKAVGCKGAIRGVYSFGGPADMPIWMDNVNCLGSEPNMEDCTRLPWGEHNCGEDEAMGVCCEKGCEGWGGLE